MSPRQMKDYYVEEVGDCAMMQVYADGFESLSRRERALAYCLSQAALVGRDIAYDLNHQHALAIRHLLEEILAHREDVHPQTLAALTAYTKLFWVHNGNYDSRNSRKFVLHLTPGELLAAARPARARGARLPSDDELARQLEELTPTLFDPDHEPMQTTKNPGPGKDPLLASAVNFYEGVSLADLPGFPARYALNSRLVKEAGKLREEIFRAGGAGGAEAEPIPPGRYARELERVIHWLEKAHAHAEPPQAESLRWLMRFFRTGEAEDFRSYNIAWVSDRSPVDTIHGFIEVYRDPLAAKGFYEASVFFADTRRTELLRRMAREATHLEKHAPWKDEYKKSLFSEPVAAVVNVITATGGAGPFGFAGVNLPNAQEIRQEYGSKSYLYWNVVEARRAIIAGKIAQEFFLTAEEIAREERWGEEAQFAMLALHEVVGHGSGRVSPRLAGDPADCLKEYYSTLEEARADLMALWSVWDDRMREIGLVPDPDVARQASAAFVRNALVQLRVVPQGDELEEDHQRAVQLIASYVRERTGAIKIVEQAGKIYLQIADFGSFRQGVGELLAEVMRIKAEGDYAAGRDLVTRYGIRFDPRWRDQARERSRAVGVPSCFASVTPELRPVLDGAGEVVDAEIWYPRDFAQQMFRFSALGAG